MWLVKWLPLMCYHMILKRTNNMGIFRLLLHAILAVHLVQLFSLCILIFDLPPRYLMAPGRLRGIGYGMVYILSYILIATIYSRKRMRLWYRDCQAHRIFRFSLLAFWGYFWANVALLLFLMIQLPGKQA